MHSLVAAVQMTSGNDVKANLAQAKKLITEASEKAGLIVLPEMFATMGMDQELKIKQREQPGSGLIQDFLRTEAQRLGVWIVGGTLPLAVANNEFQSRAACLVYNDKGDQVARYDKIHLFDVHLRAAQENYLESKAIEPGGDVVVIPTPFGKLGLAVCYDVRFPELFRRMHEKHVEIIAMPAAFSNVTGLVHWDILMRARAIENLVYMIGACQTGIHPNNRKTYGHSMIVNPWGKILADLPEGSGVVTAEVDLAYMHELRQDFPVLMHRKL